MGPSRRCGIPTEMTLSLGTSYERAMVCCGAAGQTMRDAQPEKVVAWVLVCVPTVKCVRECAQLAWIWSGHANAGRWDRMGIIWCH